MGFVTVAKYSVHSDNRMRQKCVFIRLNEVLGNTALIIFRTFVNVVPTGI